MECCRLVWRSPGNSMARQIHPIVDLLNLLHHLNSFGSILLGLVFASNKTKLHIKVYYLNPKSRFVISTFPSNHQQSTSNQHVTIPSADLRGAEMATRLSRSQGSIFNGEHFTGFTQPVSSSTWQLPGNPPLEPPGEPLPW